MVEIPRWVWGSFGFSLLVLLAIDLFSHRGGREGSRGWAIFWSIAWIAAGLAFAGFIWIAVGRHAVDEYVAAYLIEKSLSLDNMFVFLVIFKTLKIPKKNQRTALTWGIFGALVFRAIFIFAGTAAVHRWDWVNYIFGAILIFAAVHALREEPPEEQESGIVIWLSNRLPVSADSRSRKFFVKRYGIRKASPLFVSILALELSDILFAMDSVPAAFAVTQTSFLIYSSNAFAILGLRSLFAVIAEFIGEMRYLHYGLAGILAFAAFKIICSEWIHISPLFSVAVIIFMVAAAVGISFWFEKRGQGKGCPIR
jgi:tellurite resistance protein TerC